MKAPENISTSSDAEMLSYQVVKRWVNEINQAASDKSSQMVQYHALVLLHAIKRADRLAVSKLVATLTRAPPKSPLAQCLLIRYTVAVMADSPTQDRAYYEFLEGCLRHRSEMVIFEAARAICQLPGVSQRDLTPAITVLQLFLSSPKPTLRFAAVRALNRVAMAFPLTVTSCNVDLENMIGDANRSIATLAITTLLKTGSESSVERLMKQVTPTAEYSGRRPRAALCGHRNRAIDTPTPPPTHPTPTTR